MCGELQLMCRLVLGMFMGTFGVAADGGWLELAAIERNNCWEFSVMDTIDEMRRYNDLWWTSKNNARMGSKVQHRA